MGPFDFATGIDDQAVYRKTVARLAENGVALPTFAQLADPFSLPDSRRAELSSIDAVATDPAAMYETEKTAALKKLEWDGVDSDGAAQLHGTHLKSVTTDHVLETSEVDRNRMFNLGYYTWVEQQSIPVADFDRRRDQSFWRDLHGLIEIWDDLIMRFNHEARTTAH